MSLVFVFYPHCYVKCTQSEVLVFDTTNREYVYRKNIIFSAQERESMLAGYLLVTDYIRDFVDICRDKNLGYCIDYGEKAPIMLKKGINFVTSLEKERNALGINLPSYTDMLLKSVTLLFDNSNAAFQSKDICMQMDYPYTNNDCFDVGYLIQQLSPFQHLERLILSGEVNASALDRILEYSYSTGIAISRRILYNSIHIEELKSLIETYNNISVELLIDSSMDCHRLGELTNDRICLFAIVKECGDLEKFSCLDNICYLPILSKDQKDTNLLRQMTLSKEDIFNSSKSIKDYYLSDYINMNAYGHLSINNDGTVLCLDEVVGSIYDSDLSSIINSWVGKNNCMWYYTRKKKKTCMDCALQCLCPSISIYEQQKIIKCPCTI